MVHLACRSTLFENDGSCVAENLLEAAWSTVVITLRHYRFILLFFYRVTVDSDLKL